MNGTAPIVNAASEGAGRFGLRYLAWLAPVAAAAALAMSDPAAAFTLTSSASGSPLLADIDNASPVSTSMTIPVGAFAPNSNVVQDVNIKIKLGSLDNAVCPNDCNPATLFWDELIITVTHGATSVEVLHGQDSPAEGAFDLTFDDSEAALPPGLNDAVGAFAPDHALSAFNGLNAEGAWTISFFDGYTFPGDGDFLTSWSVIVKTQDAVTPPPVPAPGALVLFALGVAGTWFGRRRRS